MHSIKKFLVFLFLTSFPMIYDEADYYHRHLVLHRQIENGSTSLPNIICQAFKFKFQMLGKELQREYYSWQYI